MDIQSGHKDADADDIVIFQRFLQAAQFADFTITCQGHRWKVHKVIVATRSDFFRAAICGHFSEAESSHIDLPEDDPAIIARLLLHMYTSEYPDMPLNDLRLQSSTFSTNSEQATENDTEKLFNDLDLAVDLFAAGVKFGISAIQPQACNAARQVYREHEVPEGLGDSSRYWQIVQKAYTRTPESFSALRDTVLRDVLSRSEVLQSDQYLQVLREAPDFAYDMAVCTMGTFWKCQACKVRSDRLIKPCDCPCVKRVCKEDACVRKYVKESTCWRCDAQGTMVPLESFREDIRTITGDYDEVAAAPVRK